MLCSKCGQFIVMPMNFCPYCGITISSLTQDLKNYLSKLSSKTKECIITNHQLETEFSKVNNAIYHYLNKLGYAKGEKILLLFDNSMISSGKTGFVITERGFYSSGCICLSRSHFFAREKIKTVHLNGHDFLGDLIVNGKATNIVQSATSDRDTLVKIVKLLLKPQGGF